MNMNNLAIAYHEWSQEINYNRHTYKFDKGKGKDYIRTHGGEIYEPDDWIDVVIGYVKANDLTELYLEIRDYVRREFVWIKTDEELMITALDFLLHESYKKWVNFSYQEKLKL